LSINTTRLIGIEGCRCRLQCLSVSFGWKPGDFVLRDNQATWHYAALEQHHRLIDARIQCLSRNRDAIGRYLQVLRIRSSG
jgi:hypothetical protein